MRSNGSRAPILRSGRIRGRERRSTDVIASDLWEPGFRAMAVSNIAVTFRASSLASQLLQGFVLGVSPCSPQTCRSRLAGDGGLGYCVDLRASSLASQLLQWFAQDVSPWALRTCTSRLAGDGGLGCYVDLSGLFAGKPAPTMVCAGRESVGAADL
jgi:hypothetical protein